MISFIIGLLVGMGIMCILQINNNEVKLKSENSNLKSENVKLKRDLKTFKELNRGKKLAIDSLLIDVDELKKENKMLKEKNIILIHNDKYYDDVDNHIPRMD